MKKNIKDKFIITDDKDIYEMLISKGFVEIPNSIGKYTFINDKEKMKNMKLNFNKNEVSYTNMITL